ncbi:Hint domain-containing protein [Rhodalgimonas zhirmunskyi]|uniref:Hint domain-containing protein n=1 Tax=Rhodalgimonas zhirmunskyi TaxID=2964767 RepID=A0AAJ1X6E5_9RHOB|nr:Hint domain-containing protein [Rhodoalgimonas zhirmunskyi]MDQ2095421.1 Hint domain-containing protein [Rhodoalgimonas zhirmunskyi]
MATMVTGLGGDEGYGEGSFTDDPTRTGSIDDGSVAVDITSVFGGAGIDYFGTSYTDIYINSNGNISFGAANTAYSPNLAGTNIPTIAPFWADVNLNDGGEIYWDLDTTNGTFTVTWLDVAPYSGSGTNSFQLVLTSTGDGGFEAEFIYEDIQWTTGGSGQANTGFTDGAGDVTTFEGSGDNTALADYENNDFDNGDPNGAYSVDFSEGTPFYGDDTVDGTTSAELIDWDYTDAQGDAVDDGHGTGPYGMGDSVEAGDGADTVLGGSGDDTLLGQGGDDLLYGDYGGADSGPLPGENLSWSDQAADEASLAGGFTQNTGEIDVTVGFTDPGNNNAVLTVESTDTIYTAAGEDFSDTSSAYLYGNGDAETGVIDISFAAASGSNAEDEVENVSFRISDIDGSASNHTDILTVNAYDADNNPVTVTITPGSINTVSGNTVNGGTTGTDEDLAPGSTLFEIAGPVSRVEILYSNGQAGTHAVFVSDVHFTPITADPGDDNLYGGAGADTLFGEAGDDTLVGGIGADSLSGGDGDDVIYFAQGDTVTGGAGEDVFYFTDPGEVATGAITIDGGTTAEPGGDTLNLGGLADRTTLVYAPSATDPDAYDGTVTMLDGTQITFTNIENVICFTPGTMILTPDGERPAEDLRPGDMVITRDAGTQILGWTGRTTLPGHGKHAPVRLSPALTGARRDLLVSPQHRMLIEDWRAELLFGDPEVFVSATQMLDFEGATVEPMREVTYIHLMLDTHHVIYADGAATESFHMAEEGLKALPTQVREEIFFLYPALRFNLAAHGPTARRCLKGFESRTLLAQMGHAKTEADDSARQAA